MKITTVLSGSQTHKYSHHGDGAIRLTSVQVLSGLLHHRTTKGGGDLRPSSSSESIMAEYALVFKAELKPH